MPDTEGVSSSNCNCNCDSSSRSSSTDVVQILYLLKQARRLIKFFITLNMKKLNLKHESRLRRSAFLEWISQLEIAFSSNKYTRKILPNY